jgi:beta-mannan synthase
MAQREFSLVSNTCSAFRSLHFIPFWILFENVMSFHRTKATFIGLLELGSVNEWVVTEKLGNSGCTKPVSQILEKPPRRSWDR